jgi:DNA-binding transcriptional LysR family regulator
VATDQSAAQVRDLARSSPLGPHDDERHWLGVDLFDHGSRPPRLTETGLWFRQVAQDLLAEVARVPGEARAIGAPESTHQQKGESPFRTGTLACP